jgi:hypothetical protein
LNWNAINNRLTEEVLSSDSLEQLFDHLGCDLNPLRSGSLYRGPCPIHGGDGHNFEMKVGGHTLAIHWRCFSHECHTIFKPSLLGFVRGVLSGQQGGEGVSLKDTVNYLEQFLKGQAPVQQTPDRPKAQPAPTLPAWSREQVRNQLEIPSPYFLTRGFSVAVLKELDIGHSKTKDCSIIPLYDERGQCCIGYLERSEKPACPDCNFHHDSALPCSFKKPRWRVSPGFPKSRYLYNYAKALSMPSPFVLVVEGAGDVFRAMEAGVPAVALLGWDMSDWQAERLAALNKSILVALDNDEAGIRASESVYERISRHTSAVEVSPPVSPFKDVGEMPVEEVRKWLQLSWSPIFQQQCPR